MVTLEIDQGRKNDVGRFSSICQIKINGVERKYLHKSEVFTKNLTVLLWILTRFINGLGKVQELQNVWMRMLELPEFTDFWIRIFLGCLYPLISHQLIH